MNITSFESLACPLDGNPLQRVDKAWRCPQGHSFDIARQGYVHLLPVQKKRSKEPGDSKAMVAARQRFLAAGDYAPIAKALSQAVMRHCEQAETYSCLDAGCGEGYYLRQLAQQLPDAQALATLDLPATEAQLLQPLIAEQGCEPQQGKGLLTLVVTQPCGLQLAAQRPICSIHGCGWSPRLYQAAGEELGECPIRPACTHQFAEFGLDPFRCCFGEKVAMASQ